MKAKGNLKDSQRRAKGKPKENQRKAIGQRKESQRTTKGKPKENQRKIKGKPPAPREDSLLFLHQNHKKRYLAAPPAHRMDSS